MTVSQLGIAIVGATVIGLAAIPAIGQPIEVVDDELENDEAVVLNVRELPPETFDRYVFRNVNSSALREKVEKWLSGRLAEIDQDCQLTPVQLQKLRLAGRADINRLFAELALRRREFELVRRDLATANQFLQSLEPLQFSVTNSQSAFGLHSILDKVARTTLTSEQLQRYERQLEQRLVARRTTLQTAFVKLLEKKSRTSLSDDQKAKLMALLDGFPLKPPGPKDFGLLWDFAAQIPDEKFREILDDYQWDSLNHYFERRKQQQQFPRL